MCTKPIGSIKRNQQLLISFRLSVQYWRCANSILLPFFLLASNAWQKFTVNLLWGSNAKINFNSNRFFNFDTEIHKTPWRSTNRRLVIQEIFGFRMWKRYILIHDRSVCAWIAHTQHWKCSASFLLVSVSIGRLWHIFVGVCVYSMVRNKTAIHCLTNRFELSLFNVLLRRPKMKKSNLANKRRKIEKNHVRLVCLLFYRFPVFFQFFFVLSCLNSMRENSVILKANNKQ